MLADANTVFRYELVHSNIFGRTLQGLAMICYYLAFATPRPLLSRWRRAERADYLARTSEREPEERGRLADRDLFRTAVRGIGGGGTFVALRPTGDDGVLVVRQTSEPALAGERLVPGAGLIGRTLTGGTPLLGPLSDCEETVASRLTPLGGVVLVAPIATGVHAWGVVVVMHRRGALFPEDDLALLAQLATSAATALDHAQLVVARREQIRASSDRRIREVESRVDLMLASIKDYAMLVLDDDGTVRASHTGAQQVFGYQPDEIQRRSGGSLFEMSRDEFLLWLAEARARGVAEREGPCHRADGREFIGQTTIRPLVVEAGAPRGFVVVTRDVTDHRNFEDRLRQGQKMQAIGQLAGGVAHDFNNLLTAILGYADWLERDLVGDGRVAQVVEIQRAAERGAELTRQLLAFSRRQVVQPAHIDLAGLVDELLPMLRRLIDGAVQIRSEIADDLPPLYGDRNQVEQVVLNLVLNARDAMPEGGRVTVRAVAVGHGRDGLSGPHIRFEVTDTGIGMDAETRQRAFEPFFTTKDVGKGTGLGLSIVYGIAQQMGGVLEIDSEVRRGTTVRLCLPSVAAVLVPVSASASPAGESGTVLLVEDDAGLRRYLRQVLETQGYRVLAAESAEAAISATGAFDGDIDLVISDVAMPRRSGPELVAELVQTRPGLPALYISGYSERTPASATAATGPQAWLEKPFSSDALISRVRQILAAA